MKKRGSTQIAIGFFVFALALFGISLLFNLGDNSGDVLLSPKGDGTDGGDPDIINPRDECGKKDFFPSGYKGDTYCGPVGWSDPDTGRKGKGIYECIETEGGFNGWEIVDDCADEEYRCYQETTREPGQPDVYDANCGIGRIAPN
jgi:hypothetical protein